MRNKNLTKIKFKLFLFFKKRLWKQNVLKIVLNRLKVMKNSTSIYTR